MKKTNTEFVTELMEHSDHGVLMQAFVLEALDNYSKQFVGKTKAPAGWPNWISFDAWSGCANAMQNKLNARFSKNVIDGKASVV